MTDLSPDSPDRSSAVAWIVLSILLAAAAPQFVCMPLTNDISYYDLQAKAALSGGVLYRDMVEPNFPGIVWIHMAIRTVLGWSTEAIRAVDLAIFVGVLALMIHLGKGPSPLRPAHLWMAALTLLMYLSVSEWCHVQRDVWLLLPTLIAAGLRLRQAARITSGVGNSRVFWFAALEGVCWGAGVWIKPHVVLPALALWLVVVVACWGSRRLWTDLSGLLVGGIAMGAVGIGWLSLSGAWPWFYDMLLRWNPEYMSTGRAIWGSATAVPSMLLRLFPYWLLHLLALPLAITMLRDLRDQTRRHRSFFATLYLAWFAQSLVVQYPFDYVHIAILILACGVLAIALGDPLSPPRRSLRLAICAVTFLALLVTPLTSATRLQAWWTCIAQGSTATVKDQVARIPYPGWRDLDAVVRFLKEQQVRDGEVTCYNNDLVHVYRELNVSPSTRFVYLGTHQRYFPSRREQIEEALRNSRQRFVLTNFMDAGLLLNKARELGDHDHGFPPDFPEQLKSHFPWNLPLVFRAGSLGVHLVPPAEGSRDEPIAGR